MKKTLVHIGSSLFLGGTILFGFIHLAIANYIPNIMESKIPYGTSVWEIFFEAMIDTKTFFPYFLSILFMLVGIYFLILAYKDRSNA